MADFLMDFAAGLVSKTIAAAVTFPLERAVTLLKVEGANPGLGAPAKPYARGLFGFVSFPVPLLPEVRFLDANFQLQWNHLTNDVESLCLSKCASLLQYV